MQHLLPSSHQRHTIKTVRRQVANSGSRRNIVTTKDSTLKGSFRGNRLSVGFHAQLTTHFLGRKGEAMLPSHIAHGSSTCRHNAKQYPQRPTQMRSEHLLAPSLKTTQRRIDAAAKTIARIPTRSDAPCRHSLLTNNCETSRVTRDLFHLPNETTRPPNPCFLHPLRAVRSV